MIQDPWIETLEKIKCQKHNQKVMLFSLEEGIKLEDRLLCETCLDIIDATPKSITWSRAKQTLQVRYSQQSGQLNTEKDQMIMLVKSFKSLVDQIRAKLVQSLDEIGTSTTLWISNLEQLGLEGAIINQQSILEELVQIVVLKNSSQQNTKITNQLGQCNYNFQSKLKGSLKKLISFDFLPQLVDIFPRIFYQVGLHQQVQQQQFERQLNQQLFIELEKIGKQINIARDALKSNNIDASFTNMQQENKELDVKKVEQAILKPITYQLADEIKQEELCLAVTFNKDGSIMAATCDKQIKIWQLENWKLKSTANILSGHTGNVWCLVFSKKMNWFASGGQDSTIRCWKEIKQNNWVSSQPGTSHTSYINCLLLTRNEDQLLSCSSDKSIKVWKVDCNNNILTYDYSLDKHTSYVYCISLNESETSLVSCSYDQSIIIWGKGQLNKWEFKSYITKSTDDFGFRITFMSDNMIAWQQYSQCITHIFQLDNGVFKERPELKILLNQVGEDGYNLFPSVYNKERKVLIQKHNKFVYIIRKQNDGQFKVDTQPINCNSDANFGGLTECGQNLVIWNEETKQLRLYRINYE